MCSSPKRQRFFSQLTRLIEAESWFNVLRQRKNQHTDTRTQCCNISRRPFRRIGSRHQKEAILPDVFSADPQHIACGWPYMPHSACTDHHLDFTLRRSAEVHRTHMSGPWNRAQAGNGQMRRDARSEPPIWPVPETAEEAAGRMVRG